MSTCKCSKLSTLKQELETVNGMVQRIEEMNANGTFRLHSLIMFWQVVTGQIVKPDNMDSLIQQKTETNKKTKNSVDSMLAECIQEQQRLITDIEYYQGVDAGYHLERSRGNG